jgi:anti-sigma28 factor (negative regulator of flagellin synthesis)
MEIPENGFLQPFPDGQRSTGDQNQPQLNGDAGTPDTPGKDTVRLAQNESRVETDPQDVRLDRVMRLRRQLAEGTYCVKGDRIAGDMIDEAIENNAVLKHITTKA